MKRRQLLLCTGALAFSVGVAHTQPKPRTARVGTLVNGGPGPIMETFQSEFARLGYMEGRDLIFEPRYARGQLDRLPALASELAQLGVDVILASGGPASRAAKAATSTIPIVFSVVTDPVVLGFVASIERPGGNMTGITSLDPEQAD